VLALHGVSGGPTYVADEAVIMPQFAA